MDHWLWSLKQSKIKGFQWDFFTEKKSSIKQFVNQNSIRSYSIVPSYILWRVIRSIFLFISHFVLLTYCICISFFQQITTMDKVIAFSKAILTEQSHLKNSEIHQTDISSIERTKQKSFPFLRPIETTDFKKRTFCAQEGPAAGLRDPSETEVSRRGENRQMHCDIAVQTMWHEYFYPMLRYKYERLQLT